MWARPGAARTTPAASSIFYAPKADAAYLASDAGLAEIEGLRLHAPDDGTALLVSFTLEGWTPDRVAAMLEREHGIRFNRLLALANLPIQRFGSTLVSRGEFDAYLQLLKSAHQDANLDTVMCRSLVSVDWQGFVYDCDFNQMLGLPLGAQQSVRLHIRDLQPAELEARTIAIADHCYGCTAGQGSSCGGALG